MSARPLLADRDRERIRTKLSADRENYAARLADTNRIDDRPLYMHVREALSDIEDALQRLDAPDYGHCTRCGRWIATARLLAIPHTRTCVECAADRRGR